ncbi:MAG: 50S ribosomal protein L4 [Planctomycetota bacterium]
MAGQPARRCPGPFVYAPFSAFPSNVPMVEVKVLKGDSVEATEVDESLFGTRVLGRSLKDAVVMYEANARAGTQKAKTRSEVRGPNRKLWRQKHTGRARMGSAKSPLWRGGGVIFAPVPRDYSYSMPKKAKRAALRNAIFTKFRDGEVAIAEGWPEGKPSTKTAYSILARLGMAQSATVVTEGHDANLWRSLRNVPRVDVRALADLNARQVLLRRYMVLTPGAFEALTRRYGNAAEQEK